MTNRQNLIRWLLVITGTLAVGLGVVGAFVPVLPTTPFLLLAAACYVRSSRRLYIWLITNRFFGSFIRHYREGRGIPLKFKIFTITLLWATILCSAICFVNMLWVKIFLLIIALGVTIHLWKIKTYKSKEPHEEITAELEFD